VKIKASTIFAALPIITQIIDERRPMPQAGKYRLARMHAKLLPEWKVLNEQRSDLIKAYDTHVKIPKPIAVGEVITPAEGETAQEATQRRMGEMVDGPEYMVPDEHMPKFNADWDKIAAEEIDVNVNAIPIGMLSPANAQNGSVEAYEITYLAELLVDLTEVAD
jgi:hypothetical protein